MKLPSLLRRLRRYTANEEELNEGDLHTVYDKTYYILSVCLLGSCSLQDAFLMSTLAAVEFEVWNAELTLTEFISDSPTTLVCVLVSKCLGIMVRAEIPIFKLELLYPS